LYWALESDGDLEIDRLAAVHSTSKVRTVLNRCVDALRRRRRDEDCCDCFAAPCEEEQEEGKTKSQAKSCRGPIADERVSMRPPSPSSTTTTTTDGR